MRAILSGASFVQTGPKKGQQRSILVAVFLMLVEQSIEALDQNSTRAAPPRIDLSDLA